jgi:hypothetical protein
MGSDKCFVRFFMLLECKIKTGRKEFKNGDLCIKVWEWAYEVLHYLYSMLTR